MLRLGCLGAATDNTLLPPSSSSPLLMSHLASSPSDCGMRLELRARGEPGSRTVPPPDSVAVRTLCASGLAPRLKLLARELGTRGEPGWEKDGGRLVP